MLRILPKVVPSTFVLINDNSVEEEGKGEEDQGKALVVVNPLLKKDKIMKIKKPKENKVTKKLAVKPLSPLAPTKPRTKAIVASFEQSKRKGIFIITNLSDSSTKKKKSQASGSQTKRRSLVKNKTIEEEDA